MASNAIPPRCPSCSGPLVIVKLACPACRTEVSGEFDVCPVCRLEGDTQRLFGLFMKARGNVKQVQRDLGVSYPTSRQRIEELFQTLGQGPSPPDPVSILRRVRTGEIDVVTAERLLRGQR